MEQIISLEGVDIVSFYGPSDSNVLVLKQLYPKLRIVARGTVIKVSGDAEELADFYEKIEALREYCDQYNRLPESVIRELVAGSQKLETLPENTIIFGLNGRPIVARTKNQRKLVNSYEKNDLLFANGPAGSGKTYTSIALAVKALKNRQVKKIILSRPAVEAGENLGFLPGDMKDKIDPYLQPLYDALKDMLPAAKLNEYMEKEVIQIAPLAFMRGRTLNDAIVILDEAQNTTMSQIKMFLTRMGRNTKFIVTGDMTQVDLPGRMKSGLRHAVEILEGIKGIAIVNFEVGDSVRHPLVQNIVEAYSKDSERSEKRKEEAKMARENQKNNSL